MNIFFKNRIVKNVSWIIICRIVQSVLSLIITMLTARYLGPSNYGLVNYAASIVTFVTPIMQLGLNNVLVQEIVDYPDEEGKINGSALVLSGVSSIFCIAAVISFSLVANTGETETIIVCTLYSILLICQSGELLKYWFQAKFLSNYSAIVCLCAYTIVSAYKIFLLVIGKSIRWFAISNALDYFIISLCFVILYKKLGSKKMEFSIRVAKRMVSKGKYYILANMMISIFSQTDRIMLKLMIGDSATGYYSAAITCASLANFVFVAIIDSARPSIFEAHKVSVDKFENSVSCLYSVILYCSLFECLVVTLLAGPIIHIIYGSSYDLSIGALRIGVWYTTFSFVGMIRNIWILAEGKQKWVWVINLFGALTNVILNYMLIPVWGIYGAAIASLLTEFSANIIVSYLIRDTRHNFSIMVRGLNPKQIYKMIRSYTK